jgi:putative transposase
VTANPWVFQARTTNKGASMQESTPRLTIRSGKASRIDTVALSDVLCEHGSELLPIPAYEALRRENVSRRVGQIIINGVSTRRYKETICSTAEAAGVSRSALSRECIEEAQEQLKELVERPLGDLDIVVLMIDGIIIAQHHVLIAIGISSTGSKHVLGLRLGASENAAVATALLEDIVERGLDPSVPRLVVIDGSKALRRAVRSVLGEVPVQRCRLHKIRNVCDQLPEEEARQTRSIMKAAFSMNARGGMAKLKEHIAWLRREYPSAAGSLEEGLDEMFTVNRLELPPRLARSLSSTNMIESPNSSLRKAIGRVTRWRDGSMVLRWVGRALVDIESRWRAIHGASLLWILRQNLERMMQENQPTQAA